VTLDDAEVRQLCRIRDAGTIAAAAVGLDAHALMLVRDATLSELSQMVDAGQRARHNLMENAVGLVHSMIRQLGIQADRADVFQDGMLAVADAVDAFDPDKGRFSSFMWPHIRGAVLHAIATDSGRLDLTSGQARDRARVMTEVRHRYGDGASVTTRDLAAALTMSEARVDAALAYRPHVPLPDPSRGGADVAAPELDAGDSLGVPLERYVGMLPSRERALVELLYGFTGTRHTGAEIADLLRCSPSTVGRLRDQAVGHLHELLSHFDQADAQRPSSREAARSAEGAAPSPPRSGPGAASQASSPLAAGGPDLSRPI
jgi:DNA-directed RNA polymerase specialized sigma subunit